MRLAHRSDVGRVTQSPLGNARALKSCSSVMQQSVSIRRPLLVSGRVCVGKYHTRHVSRVRAHDKTKTAREHNHRYHHIPCCMLTGPIDGGFGRCSEPPRAGTTSSRGTLGPVIHSKYPYPTYSGVGTASGGLQGARRLAYDPGVVSNTSVGKGLMRSQIEAVRFEPVRRTNTHIIST